MNQRYQNFFQGGAPENATLEDLEKAAMANGAVVIGVAVMLALAVVALVQQDYRLSLMLVAVSSSLVLLLFINHRVRRYRTVVTIGMVLVGLAFVYLLFSGGDNGTAFVWYFTFPLFATFLLGSRFGVVISAVLALIAGVYFVVDPLLPSWTDYRAPFEARFMVAYLIVTFFAFLYQRLKESSYRLVESRTQELLVASDAAQEANRTKTEFLANMSHELRTPLNHIIGFSELMRDEKVGPITPDQEEYLGDVLDSSRHLLALINDILDMSKVEAGKMELQRERVEIDVLIQHSTQMILEKARAHRVTVTTMRLTNVSVVEADDRRMRQILYNLVSNAVKFTPDGGTVSIEVTDSGQNDLLFSVSDTGIGIAKEDFEKVFRPFDQANPSASRERQGTGLGLSLTKTLVEQHGGRIWLESPGPDKGTTFHFTIPREPQPQGAQIG